MALGHRYVLFRRGNVVLPRFGSQTFEDGAAALAQFVLASHACTLARLGAEVKDP
ncbi:MAG TPA: hypothetical protein VNA57_04480 [Acidimicrobiales bacterium]|nr:hypothetical protein [Acidimicrobiales bacterium]